MSDTFDMVIIGAGLSGIGSACRYVTEFPDGQFAVLESREAIGGTWDLFRYPGIRSDSDMLTLGYDFRPWPGVKTLAGGPAIKAYVEDTARAYGIDDHIQFHSRVIAANFDTSTDLWTLTINDTRDGSQRTIRTRFVLSCAGYYRYDKGHDPHFDGREDFAGDIVHPQFWPEDYDYADKRIAVIGSGATAVTLVPELAKTARHVVQVQRTPTYVASLPSEDPVMKITDRILSKKLSYRINRWKNVKLAGSIYRRAKKNPAKTRRNIRKRAIKALGKDYPVDVHFNPPYEPWDQRLCVVPEGDMFRAINRGEASIVTGQIDRFVDAGILMQDGTLVEADIIVTATGLEMNFGRNYPIAIDGNVYDQSEHFLFKGAMTSDLPNMIAVTGYTNASWTLRADLLGRYLIRLMKYMRERGFTRVMPVAPEGMVRHPVSDFQSGYFRRVIDTLPRQGDRMPWLNVQNYKHDVKHLIEAPIEDDALHFSQVDTKAEPLPEAAE